MRVVTRRWAGRPHGESTVTLLIVRRWWWWYRWFNLVFARARRRHEWVIIEEGHSMVKASDMAWRTEEEQPLRLCVMEARFFRGGISPAPAPIDGVDDPRASAALNAREKAAACRG